MSGLYFTRAELRRHAPAAALRELLLPHEDGRRAGAGHRLMWTLFGDAPDRERDFLWREADGGVFYLLSRRPPEDRHSLFDLQCKPFAPQLGAGDVLAFRLRANATVSRSAGPGQRGKPSDVVMDAIRHVPSGERAATRLRAVQEAGRHWLAAQGTRNGFALGRGQADVVENVGHCGVSVTGYRTIRVDHSGPTAKLGVLEFDGVLTVTDPDAFTMALARGFGRAKAFGCGLMLIRRARD